jgi:hypothetical protein
VRNVISSWNEQQARNVDQDVDAPTAKSDKTQDIAFIFRTVMKTYEKTKPAYSEIEVQSQGLRDLLRSVIGDYPGQSFDGTSVYIPGPFQAVVHYWEELRAEIGPKEGDSEETKQAREDLNEMMNSIRASTELESYFKTRESNMESGVITYEFLWTIFRPKTKVFARPFLNIPQIFEVPYSPDPYERRRVSIPCWCYDYNGKSQVKTFYEFDIEHFRGTKDISSLFCYPINYLKEEDGQLEELQERLRKRGEKFIELCTVEKGSKQMSEYNDIVLLASGSLSRSLVQDVRLSRVHLQNASVANGPYFALG